MKTTNQNSSTEPQSCKGGVISRRTGIVKATKEQLESVGISDVPNGALVEIYEIDEYESVYGLASKMRYKYEDFDYIIPTSWVV